MFSLSIPVIDVNTNQLRTANEFTLTPCRSKDNVKRYNEYCHKFKKHMAEILLQMCKRHIIDNPTPTEKPKLYETFIKQHNYSFMIQLNTNILSNIILFMKYHLKFIDILDKYKILNSLYLTLSTSHNSLYDINYRSLIAFIVDMLTSNVGAADWIQKQEPNSHFVPSYVGKHDGDLTHLWIKMLYLILQNGANPLLPSNLSSLNRVRNIGDLNKLKKYFWCFDKKVNSNLSAPQSFSVLSGLAFCGMNHKYHKLIIDIINKYPLTNIYSTPYLRPSVFTFCVRNYDKEKIDIRGSYVADSIFYFGGAMNINLDEIYFKYKVQDFINLMTCCTRSKLIQFIDKNKIKNKSYYNLQYDLDEMMHSKNELNKFEVMKESNKIPSFADNVLNILKCQYKTLLFTIKEIQKYIKQNTKDYLFENAVNFVLNNDIIECILDEYVFEDLSYLDNNKIINQNRFLCCWFDGIADCNVEWFIFFRNNVLNKLNQESMEYLRRHILSKPPLCSPTGIINCIKHKCHGSGSKQKALSLTERLKFMFKITNIKYIEIPFVDENIALKIYKHHHGGPSLPKQYFEWARSVHIY